MTCKAKKGLADEKYLVALGGLALLRRKQKQ